MSFARRLTRSCRQLFQSWYSVDRIRIAPTSGRLLQLQVGDAVLLFNKLYTIQQRRLDSGSHGRDVNYVLAGSAGRFELRVTRNSANNHSSGELVLGDDVHAVFDEDVVVLRPEPESQASVAAMF